MNVEVYQARLLIDKKSIRLTRAIARQFPLLDGNGRRSKAATAMPEPKAEAGREANKPIGKVLTQILKHQDSVAYDRGWLYLVENVEAGLAWVPAITPMDRYAQKIIAQGGWVDCPANVPTLIL